MTVAIETNSVAVRVNFKTLQDLPVGSAVRVGGKISAPARLTTTDGGELELSGDMVQEQSGFVEVNGTKTSSDKLAVNGVVSLGQNVDMELWDEAIKMAQLPQLRELFAPAQVA